MLLDNSCKKAPLVLDSYGRSRSELDEACSTVIIAPFAFFPSSLVLTIPASYEITSILFFNS